MARYCALMIRVTVVWGFSIPPYLAVGTRCVDNIALKVSSVFNAYLDRL